MKATTSLPEMLERSALARPGHRALVFDDEQRTYRELAERTDRLAAALAERGIRPGDRVALLMHNGIEIVEAIFGCQRAGACPVPVNFRLLADEVAHILADCGASGVIAGKGLLALAAEAARAVPSVRVRIASGEPHPGFESFERAIAAGTPGPRSSPRGEDLAFLMYTSGTTGRPKGAMLTHSNLLAATRAWIEEVGASEDDVWLSGQPLFHIGGLNGLLPFVDLGATSILNPTTGFDPAHTIDLLTTHSVSRCVFVPTQWEQICKQPGAIALAQVPCAPRSGGPPPRHARPSS